MINFTKTKIFQLYNSIKKRKFAFAALFIVISTILYLLMPGYSKALVTENICRVLGALTMIQLYLASAMFYLGGEMLDMVIGHALNVQNMHAVEMGWSLARDTVNMFFVIFLLIIAFATILRIESYHYKQLLPKLIVSILLVNFSRTICSVLIEFSNVLTGAFLNFGSGNSSASAISALMGVQRIYQLDNNFDIAGITNTTMLVSYILVTLIVTVMAWVFCGLAGMLLFRTVILLVLVVISPLAFGMNILPVTQSYFKRWWDEFVKYLFYAPIAAFCLYLSAVVVADGSSNVGNLGLGETLTQGANAGANTENILPSSLSQPETMWEFGIAFGLLALSIMMIKEGGGMGAQLAMNAAKKGAFGAYGLAGKGLARGAKWGRKKVGGEGWKEGAESWKKAGGVKKALGYLGQGIGAATRLTYLPEAWKAQAEKEYKEQESLGVGWARNKLNKTIGKLPLAAEDPTDYEYRAQMALVAEARDFYKTENQGQGWEFLVNRMKLSLGNTGEGHFVEEALRELNPTRNLNEMTRLEMQDEAFGKRLHSNTAEGQALVGQYSAQAVLDILETQFGKEKGRKMMIDMGEQGVASGSWVCKGYLMRAPDNTLVAPGEKYQDAEGNWQTYTPQNYAEGWAAEFSKRDIGDRVNVFRGDFNALQYDKKGGEHVTGLQSGYAEYVRQYGWGGQDAYRAVQRMSPNVKKALMNDKHFDEIAKIIESQLTSSDNEIRTRGQSNLQFYYEIGEAAGMSDTVKKRMQGIVKNHNVTLAKPGGKGVSGYGDVVTGGSGSGAGETSSVSARDEAAAADMDED